MSDSSQKPEAPGADDYVEPSPEAMAMLEAGLESARRGEISTWDTKDSRIREVIRSCAKRHEALLRELAKR